MKERQHIWFTSDLHWSHVSILYFYPERRNAAGITLEELQADKNLAVEKHDKWLIDKWNDTVKREDTVYILGDLCLGNKAQTEKILHQLKGKKMLIFGNHDKSAKGENERFFEWCGDLKEAKFNNQQFSFIDPNETFCVELCHYPMLTWNRRPHGTCMVHGHTHGSIDNFNTTSLEMRVDVGFDGKLAKECASTNGFIELENLYKHFCGIRDAAGCPTFQEYQEWLMKNQGFRM